MKLPRDSEPPRIEVQKLPFPYQGAFAVASDIDSSSPDRFRAVHALFCGRDVIKQNSPEWRTLGLTSNSPGFNKDARGVLGLGLEFSDSFFLVGDPTTFGMYRYVPESDRFLADHQQGEDCSALIRGWIKEGKMDAFHAFLHYTRAQIEPLLKEFYRWCERENVAKPAVWVNHSAAKTPTGLCPDKLQAHPLFRLVRLAARKAVGPAFGRKRQPLSNAFVRYQGGKPGSPFYINDILAENGLRYVWLNQWDAHRDQIVLPEGRQNGRSTILQPVTMDDGVRYWRFERCYGGPLGRMYGEVFLRDSEHGCDASRLITESNLTDLCLENGSCILYTHWTHFRSMPVADETLLRFELLRNWRDKGRVWVTSTSRLLEWTRRRTFLVVNCIKEPGRLAVEFNGVDDPIFGHESLVPPDLHRLSFRVQNSAPNLVVSVCGQRLNPQQINRVGDLCWLNTNLSLAQGSGEEDSWFGPDLSLALPKATASKRK